MQTFHAAIPYIKTPQSDPLFRIYFSKEWSNALHLSLRNFVSKMFNGTHILKYILSHFYPSYHINFLAFNSSSCLTGDINYSSLV